MKHASTQPPFPIADRCFADRCTADRPPRRRVGPRVVAALSLAALVLLAACGGGGGGGSAADPAPAPAQPSGVPAQATTVILSSQASADALARTAEQRTRDMRLASGLGGTLLPGAAPSSAEPAQAFEVRRHPLSVTDYSTTLCSRGSASLDIDDALLARFRNDPNATLQAGDAIGFSTSACVVKASAGLGDVTVGNFGVGASIDGKFVLTLVQRSGTDYLFSLAYTGFTYTPAGAAAYDPLTATLQFGVSGGQQVFSLDLPDARIVSTPAVGSTAGVTTVASGTIRAPAAAAAGGAYADFSYVGWVYSDSSTRASAGAVTVGGASGTRAVVTATAGGYSVDITTGAGTARFSVVR